ncbi:MAG: 4Fe-4S binding protein [Anaerolineaceae bacterium]|nr:4Fe-4S binding protein [Anaerolineaceae bacterium]
MKRDIIQINEELCNGCGLCITACAEGALKLVDGKAKLITDAYCDGLGACLPDCPTGAINIIQREAVPFDEELVHAMLNEKSSTKITSLEGIKVQTVPEILACGCSGSEVKSIDEQPSYTPAAMDVHKPVQQPSQLRQWPVQIKLASPAAPYFKDAHLLIAADCTAYAYGTIHQDYMKGRITLIGCPKLDNEDYSEKLSLILANHNIQSLMVLRMQVPCCGGLTGMIKNAMQKAGVMIPWRVVTIAANGEIISDI